MSSLQLFSLEADSSVWVHWFLLMPLDFSWGINGRPWLLEAFLIRSSILSFWNLLAPLIPKNGETWRMRLIFLWYASHYLLGSAFFYHVFSRVRVYLISSNNSSCIVTFSVNFSFLDSLLVVLYFIFFPEITRSEFVGNAVPLPA